MRYSHLVTAAFLSRPNRFTARVMLDGREETVHVRNTGRCRELLIPGCRVWLEKADREGRKTAYDLVCVEKSDGRVVNMDSLAPNRLVGEWLESQGCQKIHPEFVYGESRLDFAFEKEGAFCLMEVKGCTLEVAGAGYFPDAPTERGLKHVRELTRAARENIRAYLAFVIQMDGVNRVLPNDRTMPSFGEAVREAELAGVRVLHLATHVTPEEIRIISPGLDT